MTAKSLALAAATAWCYFLAKGRFLLGGALSASEAGPSILMQKRNTNQSLRDINQLLREPPPPSSAAGSSSSSSLSKMAEKLAKDPSSSSSDGAIPAGLETPSAADDTQRNRSRRSSASKLEPSSARTSAPSTSLSAASSEALAGAEKLLRGDIVSTLSPAADQTEHVGSYFEVTANQEGWITLVSAVARKKLTKTFRRSSLRVITAEDGEEQLAIIAQFAGSESRKRAAETRPRN